MAKLYIHAVNVHTGGGKNLLLALLNSVPKGLNTFVAVDSRMTIPQDLENHIKYTKIKPTIFQRLRSEYKIEKKNVKHNSLLFFGNLPPIRKYEGKVTLFLQNRYLIDTITIKDFPIKTLLRIVIERLWLKIFIRNVDEIIVQSLSMNILVKNKFNNTKKVSVFPFLEDIKNYSRELNLDKKEEKKYDFIYVASGEPHKNHKNLINAWCDLADQGIFPSLVLTLDESNSNQLLEWIKDKISKYRLNIVNMGKIPFEQVRELYGMTHSLIYPSTYESFGIPLIEARQHGLSVIASELDYVRDIIDPEQTFDPQSYKSISRAVKRFFKINEPILPLKIPSEFIDYIIS